jgi:hypothetical protein
VQGPEFKLQYCPNQTNKQPTKKKKKKERKQNKKKPITRKDWWNWLKVNALSSNTSTGKKK